MRIILILDQGKTHKKTPPPSLRDEIAAAKRELLIPKAKDRPHNDNRDNPIIQVHLRPPSLPFSRAVRALSGDVALPPFVPKALAACFKVYLIAPESLRVGNVMCISQLFEPKRLG